MWDDRLGRTFMELVPRVDMAGGESRFSLPDPDDPDRPFEDVAQVAARFQQLGARRLQVIDIDRATEHGDNDDRLVEVLNNVGVPVDAGGGVRSMRRVQQLLDSGVARVVLSTMGVLHLDWLKEVGICFGDRVIQSVDVKDGAVLVKGRTESVEAKLTTLLETADEYGLGGFVVNACDEKPTDDLVAEIAGLAGRLTTDVWASGIDLTVADLDRWQERGVAGVVAGKEIYTGGLDLTQGIKHVAPADEASTGRRR